METAGTEPAVIIKDSVAPLVSVVMIFKDARTFMWEAARSVLAQTWSRLELVLVDDGGTDGSDRLAAQLVAADPERVRVLHHPGRVNLGMGASRQLGIRAARGEMTAFLDADDVWLPGHLEHEVALLQAHPDADMVCGRVVVWRSWADPDAEDELSELAFAPGVVVPPPRLLAATLRNGGVATTPCSLLVRTPPLRDCRASTAFRGSYEDQVLNSQLQLRVAAVMSGAVSAYYRQHPGSSSSTASQHGPQHPSAPGPSRRRFLRWLAEQPELLDMQDEELLGLLATELAAVDPPAGRSRAAAVAKHRLRPLLTPQRQGSARTAVQRALLHAARFGSPQPVGRVPAADGVAGYYLERFLHAYGEDIAGSVAQWGDVDAAGRAGPRVTGVVELAADLPPYAACDDAPVDCLLAVGVRDLPGEQACAALRGRLRPGGVLLMTFPGIAPVEGSARVVTRTAVQPAFAAAFGADCVTVSQHGNVLAATAVLQGLPAGALSGAQLAYADDAYPVLTTVRAVRPA